MGRVTRYPLLAVLVLAALTSAGAAVAGTAGASRGLMSASARDVSASASGGASLTVAQKKAAAKAQQKKDHFILAMLAAKFLAAKKAALAATAQQLVAQSQQQQTTAVVAQPAGVLVTSGSYVSTGNLGVPVAVSTGPARLVPDGNVRGRARAEPRGRAQMSAVVSTPLYRHPLCRFQ